MKRPFNPHDNAGAVGSGETSEILGQKRNAARLGSRVLTLFAGVAAITTIIACNSIIREKTAQNRRLPHKNL